MSIRFAAPASAMRNRMPRSQARAACPLPANDNGPRHTSETALHAALRHFADHGLAAARHAQMEAQKARFQGDEQTYEWWRDICRALDRRMASELDRQVAGN